MMVKDPASGEIRQCGYDLSNTVRDSITSKLLYHFSTRPGHQHILRAELPAIYEDYKRKGKIRHEDTNVKQLSIGMFLEKEAETVKRPHFWSEKNMSIIQDLATEVALDKLPPAAVDRRGRLEGIRIRASWFKPPSRWWLSTNYLPAVVKVTRKRVAAELQVSSPHVAITSDGWQSRYAGHFQSLTASSPVEF